jgi:carboxyl-terminal processing protease
VKAARTHILCRALVLLCSISLLSLSACRNPLGSELSESLAKNPVEQKEQAESLYREAWAMLREEYVDSNFNGQDWQIWRDKFQGKLQNPDDAYIAIQTMAASLNDEYTRFLLPRDMREQTMTIDSRLYGVGIQISLRNGKLIVLATIDDTPAKKAGLLPADIITHGSHSRPKRYGGDADRSAR